MDRQEHLDWCKERALEYVERGELADAVASMMSDLGKHPETECNNPTLAAFGMMAVMQKDPEGVRRFITGFN